MRVVNHPLVVFAGTFLLLWLAHRLGIAIRSRHHGMSEAERSDYGVIIGATLTLLALLIGFTFSMATTRYDLRKNLEEEEANAIGTEYNRVDFLPAAQASRLRVLLQQYTSLRIRFYVARNEPEIDRVNRETATLQNQLWAEVVAGATLQPTPLTGLASSGMNDVLNSQGYTQAAWWNRIPRSAWMLMLLIAFLSNVLLGYGMHTRANLLSVILPLVAALSFFLIADIDSPRGGIIRVQPQNLHSLAGSLTPP